MRSSWGGSSAGLGQGVFGPAVRVPGVMEGGQLQPGGRIVGEVGRHLMQDPPEPRLVGGTPPQQIEEEEITFAVGGVRREARHHQIGEDHAGIFDSPPQQGGEPLHLPGRQEIGLNGLVARPSQGFEYAAPGQGLLRRTGELHRQPVEVDGRRGGIPQIGRHPLGQETDSGRDAGHPAGRQQAARHSQDCRRGQHVPQHRHAGDLQEVDSGMDGIVGVERGGQIGERPLDVAHRPPAEGLDEFAGQGRRRPALRPQRPPNLEGSAAAFAGAQASPFGHRVGQGEVLRQPVDSLAQPLVVAGAEAHHGLAEQPPGRERRTPGHRLQEPGSPLPVPGIHGLDTARHRSGVSPEGVIRVERFEPLPAPMDHESVRQRPFGPGKGRPGAQVVRVGLQGVGPVQMAEVQDQIVFRQRPGGDGRPVLSGPGTHGGRLLRHAFRRKLPGAPGAGAEGEDRQPFQTLVCVLCLPEQIEGLAPISLGQALPSLLQQLSGRCVLRFRPLPLSASVLAVALSGHRTLSCGPEGGNEQAESSKAAAGRSSLPGRSHGSGDSPAWPSHGLSAPDLRSAAGTCVAM